MRLIIATKNKNKFKEIKAILKGLRLRISYLGKLLPDLEIKEDGKTFFENALKKACKVSQIFPQDLVVAEDSGLEVESLNNRPGIFSKRFAGKNATDLENNLKLLRLLKNKKNRNAQFVCVVVLMKNKKLIKKFTGKLKGKIHDRIEGKGGFGYDPVFFLPRYKKTVAQLTPEEKNKISHRAQAFSKLKKFLSQYLSISLQS